MEEQDHQAAAAVVARRLIDANRYMTLATADVEGRPWASPVFYAPDGYRELLWVSEPSQRHSHNLAVRPGLGIVIFDSTVAVGAARAVYVDADAEEVTGEDVERGMEIYSRRTLETGGRAWDASDVLPPARLRLYRARALEVSVLDYFLDTGPGDRRIVVPPEILDPPRA
ncbi:MAG TPA: pyridoxamine 5'-phosphate oxidase family protein [Propionibacteriaceae bacterium]|jgi:uncharacterized protein YhbP (UPF0306 family)|nr:pyridoxamine 5'-phosphate oxidase family protein [Propionibacteriaceae bacterium]